MCINGIIAIESVITLFFYTEYSHIGDLELYVVFDESSSLQFSCESNHIFRILNISKLQRGVRERKTVSSVCGAASDMAITGLSITNP